MTIDLGNPLSNSIVQWAIIIIALILALVILRYFFHILAHILHFIMRFFWHGCGTVIAILILWYILRYFRLI